MNHGHICRDHDLSDGASVVVMTTQALHQPAADRAILCTLKLIPPPSQPGQQQDDCDGDQPTRTGTAQGESSTGQIRDKDCSSTALSSPRWVRTQVVTHSPSSTEQVMHSICLNRIPGSSLLLLHGVSTDCMSCRSPMDRCRRFHEDE